MSKTASGMRLSGLAVTVAFLGAGCMAGRATTPPSTRWTEPPTPSPISSSRAVVSATPGGSNPAAVGPRLIVLADGAGRGLGLWAIDMQGHWTTLGSTPGATALGRTTGGVAVGTGHQIDVRPASDLTQPGAKIELRGLELNRRRPSPPWTAPRRASWRSSPRTPIASATALRMMLGAWRNWFRPPRSHSRRSFRGLTARDFSCSVPTTSSSLGSLLSIRRPTRLSPLWHSWA